MVGAEQAAAKALLDAKDKKEREAKEKREKEAQVGKTNSHMSKPATQSDISG